MENYFGLASSVVFFEVFTIATKSDTTSLQSFRMLSLCFLSNISDTVSKSIQ